MTAHHESGVYRSGSDPCAVGAITRPTKGWTPRDWTLDGTQLVATNDQGHVALIRASRRSASPAQHHLQRDRLVQPSRAYQCRLDNATRTKVRVGSRLAPRGERGAHHGMGGC